MLTYLIKATEQLLLGAVMTGLLYAFACRHLKSQFGKRAVWCGTVLGVFAAILMSYMKNATSLVETGVWNLRIFGTAILALVLLLILRKKEKPSAVFCAILLFTVYLYSLPDFLAYPYGFLSAGQSILSTDFLFKLIGFLGGALVVFLVALSVFQCACKAREQEADLVLFAVLIVNALRQLSVGLQILLARRVIKSNHTLFTIAKYTSNYSNLFIYAALLIAAVLPVLLFVRSLRVKEPYENPAQHRKIRIKWIRTRRWAALVAVAMLCSVMNMTVVKAIDNREVNLSPVEDAKIIDDNVIVPFEQVEDGHLHRFAYVTDEGTQVRFIVIKKPNASSYGIGLDACDICGETGYYEKDGQVVCKLCDVVMNINTIGFKGGCNPIVIPYEIKDGTIRVPISGLIEHAGEFQ